MQMYVSARNQCLATWLELECWVGIGRKLTVVPNHCPEDLSDQHPMMGNVLNAVKGNSKTPLTSIFACRVHLGIMVPIKLLPIHVLPVHPVFTPTPSDRPPAHPAQKARTTTKTVPPAQNFVKPVRRESTQMFWPHVPVYFAQQVLPCPTMVVQIFMTNSQTAKVAEYWNSVPLKVMPRNVICA
jgi:hypothetical protein